MKCILKKRKVASFCWMLDNNILRKIYDYCSDDLYKLKRLFPKLIKQKIKEIISSHLVNDFIWTEGSISKYLSPKKLKLFRKDFTNTGRCLIFPYIHPSIQAELKKEFGICCHFWDLYEECGFIFSYYKSMNSLYRYKRNILVCSPIKKQNYEQILYDLKLSKQF